jgi:ATP-dependent Lon protease
LGEVMQESVTAAWGYLKTTLSRNGALQELWETSTGRAYLAEHYSPGDGGTEGPGELGTLVESTGGGSAAESGEAEAGGPSDHELLSALEVRMHLPEGAVPKEGPSAGVAVAVSLLSALTQVPIVPRVALSGEITLTGQVLPVGGLKEKLLAALREGVRKVILPEGMRGQVKELPHELVHGLEIVYVSHFTEVVPQVLVAVTAGGTTGEETA